MSEYILEMKDICKSFPGVKALDHVSLQLKPGHVHSLMGENGAGKSTLMKCLFGIYKKDEGKIIYDGEEVNISDPFDALNRGIAMVHQELMPIRERSIAENGCCSPAASRTPPARTARHPAHPFASKDEASTFSLFR